MHSDILQSRKCISYYYAPIDISNAMNEYFCNVVQNMVDNIPPTSKSSRDYLSPSIADSIDCDPVISHEMFRLIRSLRRINQMDMMVLVLAY